MALQRLFESPQRPRPTFAERRAQAIALDPPGNAFRGIAVAAALSVAGFWAPLAVVVSLLG